jgi:hypothetical protein
MGASGRKAQAEKLNGVFKVDHLAESLHHSGLPLCEVDPLRFDPDYGASATE